MLVEEALDDRAEKLGFVVRDVVSTFLEGYQLCMGNVCQRFAMAAGDDRIIFSTQRQCGHRNRM